MIPKVSVVVVSYFRANDLRRALEAVLASDWPRDRLEIVVVDNASTDGAPDVAASFEGVRVIRNQRNVGFAEANDQALAHCTGDYVALVNNDALVDPGWIRGCVARLEANPKCAATGGKQYFWNDENPPFDRKNDSYGFTTVDPATGFTHATTNAPDELREVATLSGSCVMIRRAAIDDATRGGADPFLDPIFFTYYEETDFFARCLRRGWTLLYEGEPAVWHQVRGGEGAPSYRYLYYMHRNRVLFAARSFDDRDFAELEREVLRAAASRAFSAPIALVRGKNDELRALRDAWTWLAKSWSLVLHHRRMLRDLGVSYGKAVRELQAKASYYGHDRPEVIALVPPDAKHVVDVGCAGGALGNALKHARPGVEVRGIEPTTRAGSRAKALLDDVLIGGAEDPYPSTWPRPDCVIFADVLEHLADPWTVLRTWRDRLEPGGALVVSLPNVGHHSVAFGLLAGRWDYQEAGVLDRTHLRFFTRESARRLVEDAGFRIEEEKRVIDIPRAGPGTKTLRRFLGRQQAREARADALGGGVRGWVADACTVQFLIRARRE